MATVAPISTAVMQTSPSPWAKCPSPVENSAPLRYTGRKSFEPAVNCFTSKFPPHSRGGMVRSPSVAVVPVEGIAPPASGGKTTLPVAIASFSRFVHSFNLSFEGATPDTPMKGAPGMRTPGSCSEVAKLFSIFHFTMNGVEKTSGRNPNPGTMQVKAKDCCAFDEDRARQWVDESRVQFGEIGN